MSLNAPGDSRTEHHFASSLSQAFGRCLSKMTRLDTPIDPFDPAHFPVSSGRPPCPEGSVPLHQLCGKCLRLCKNWKFLDILQSEQSGRPIEKWSGADLSYTHSKVAHIMTSSELCHFCRMMLQVVREAARNKNGQIPAQWLNRPVTLKGVKFAGQRLENSIQLTIPHVMSYALSGLSMIAYKIDRDISFDSPSITYSVPCRAIDDTDQAKSWLHGCRSSHKACNAWCSSLGSRHERPTRILELTSHTVRLRCDVSNILDFEYVTLSHIWGDDPSQQLRLEQSRLAEFTVSIPPDELPLNFLEAICITRNIGFKYLWVDSLCIIQDSALDWSVEASKMAAVYSNAICCIAFLFPPPGGVDRSREDPRTLKPCIMRKASASSLGLYILPFVTKGSNRGRRCDWLSPKKWPWSSRAWTFQEYLLSPRTIFCGHENLMWECAEVFREELVDSNTIQILEPYMSVRKELLTPSDSAPIARKPDTITSRPPPWLKEWWALVAEYRSRRLTKPDDRTMAFAAVAEAFQTKTQEVYLAGSWMESLHYGLLWYRRVSLESLFPGAEYPKEQPVIVDQQRNKLVPSWSWFALPHEVAPGIISPYVEGPLNRETIYVAQLLNFQWPNQPPGRMPATAYHDFAGLKIVLKLPTYTTTLTKHTSRSQVAHCQSLNAQLASLLNSHHDTADRSGVPCDIDDKIPPRYSTYWFDQPQDAYQPPATALIALVTTEKSPRPQINPQTENKWGFDTNETYHFYGLGLVPGEVEGTWKRHGFWEASITMSKSEYETLSPEIDVDNQSKEALCPLFNQRIKEDGKWPHANVPFPFLYLKGVKMETLTLV